MDGPSPAIRSPRAVSPSSPTPWSRLVGPRSARRMSITSSSGRSTCSAISSSVGVRPSSTASLRSASEIFRARADQPQHPLLDEVAQGESLALVLAGDRDHEPQVRVDHAVLGLEIAALDPLRQLDLLLRPQQPVTADLVE